MTRLAVGVVIGLGVGVIFAAALGIHAAEYPTPDTIEAATAANVNPLDLQGAVNETQLDPFEYLYRTGELERPTPPSLRDYAYQTYPDVAWCMEKIVDVESNGWFTGGWNPKPHGRWGEHASGLGGFLPSTWASTPMRERSIWDGYAQVDAIAWMLTHDGQGRAVPMSRSRAGEFAAVTWGRCGRLW